MSNPAVIGMMDCSTAHLDRASRDALRAGCDRTLAPIGPNASSIPYGWLVYADADLSDDPSCTPVLNAIFLKAVNLNCEWVKFDRDGMEHDDLPSFEDWSKDEVGLDEKIWA